MCSAIVIIMIMLLFVGSDILFMEDPTEMPPGLLDLEETERATIERWLRNTNLGFCDLV